MTTDYRIASAFPPLLAPDVERVLKALGQADHAASQGDSFHMGETLVTVPYRVYFLAPQSPATLSLSLTEQAILAAILTRHNSGFQREKWAKLLVETPVSWATPFMALLLEDYACQIQSAIEHLFHDDWIHLLQQFSAENPTWKATCNQRVVSNHACDRHLYYHITDYPAYRIMTRSGLWNKKVCPKLVRRGIRAEKQRRIS